MLGHSVSYFLSQYWRNAPLYAEKLIPLLDTCLSNNFVYSDKVAGAFYELINKYQHTDDLPLENLKEFIREQGYGYILDLMIQDEENIKLLWYLLVLIHQLKGSRDGLEVVLSLFQPSYEADRVSLLDSLGEATVTSEGGFLTNKGANILTHSLTYVGACPRSSGGHIYYELPSGSYISDAGNYILQFTNASLESLGKLNSIKFIAHRANLTDTILYENKNMPYTYPAKTYTVNLVQGADDSPIKSLEIEYTCDFFNQRGMCLSGVSIKRGNTTYLPITDGTITTDDTFFTDNEVASAFQIFNIANTTPINQGEITLKYDTAVDAGTYTMEWDLLGGNVLTEYINSFRIGVRYTDYSASDTDADDNTVSVFSSDELTYQMVNKKYSVEFKALKPFNQIYISYEIAGSGTAPSVAKGIISGLSLYKDAQVATTKTIPNMVSTTSPKGSVVSNSTFADDHESFKLFNYTSILGATPTSDGYIKYTYEEADRPVAGDYTFTWANNSTDNNAYFTSVSAFVEFVDGTTQQISSQQDLNAVNEKTKYSYKFTTLKTIKSLTISYTCHYNSEGEGGTFLEANITQTKDLESVSGINVWYESLPVAVENTFTIESNIDVAKIGDEFFSNFKNFVRHYVYPELQKLRVKYSLEGVQAQRFYNQSKIHYNSYLDRSCVFSIRPTPSDATVAMTVNGSTYYNHSMDVETGSTVNYTVSKDYYFPVSGSTTVTVDTTFDVPLTEYDKYTTIFVAKNSATHATMTNATYSLVSAEGSTTTDRITVHDGTSVNYTVGAPYFTPVTGTITPTQDSTIDVEITELPIYTLTFQPVELSTSQPITGVTFDLQSEEGTSTTNSITVHEGTTVSYELSKDTYSTVYATIVANSTQTITVPMSRYILTGEMEGHKTVDEVNNTYISEFYD